MEMFSSQQTSPAHGISIMSFDIHPCPSDAVTCRLRGLNTHRHVRNTTQGIEVLTFPQDHFLDLI